MRILHCADLHLDAKMTTHLSKEKAKERLHFRAIRVSAAKDSLLASRVTLA